MEGMHDLGALKTFYSCEDKPKPEFSRGLKCLILKTEYVALLYEFLPSLMSCVMSGLFHVRGFLMLYL